MPEGDNAQGTVLASVAVDPRLVLALLLAALAVTLAFFAFLAWRRRTIGYPRAPGRTGNRPSAPQPTGPLGPRRQSPDDSAPKSLEEYYGVLGLVPGASPGEVSGAYRCSTREWDPHRFREGSERRREAEQRVRSIEVAFDTIRETWPESLGEVAQAFDQISSSGDAARRPRSALIDWWLALALPAQLGVIWIVLLPVLWIASGVFILGLYTCLIGYALSYALIGPDGHWVNLILLIPLFIAGEASDSQSWRAFALVALLVPVYGGIWIWRTARRSLPHGRQHLVLALLLVFLLGFWFDSCPVDIPCIGPC